jgi:amino acid transporter
MIFGTAQRTAFLYGLMALCQKRKEKDRKMVKKRGLVSYILFSGITCGIYGWWRIHVLARDVNVMCKGDGKKTRGLLALFFLGLITFSIYNWVWLYNVGERLQDSGSQYGITIKEGGSALLLWMLLGSLIVIGPFIALYILFKNVNALADEYNRKLSDTESALAGNA